MLQSSKKIIKYKAGLLNLAEELGNVSRSLSRKMSHFCSSKPFNFQRQCFKPAQKLLCSDELLWPILTNKLLC